MCRRRVANAFRYAFSYSFIINTGRGIQFADSDVVAAVFTSLCDPLCGFWTDMCRLFFPSTSPSSPSALIHMYRVITNLSDMSAYRGHHVVPMKCMGLVLGVSSGDVAALEERMLTEGLSLSDINTEDDDDSIFVTDNESEALQMIHGALSGQVDVDTGNLHISNAPFQSETKFRTHIEQKPTDKKHHVPTVSSTPAEVTTRFQRNASLFLRDSVDQKQANDSRAQLDVSNATNAAPAPLGSRLDKHPEITDNNQPTTTVEISTVQHNSVPSMSRMEELYCFLLPLQILSPKRLHNRRVQLSHTLRPKPLMFIIPLDHRAIHMLYKLPNNSSCLSHTPLRQRW